jgi:hypothetical protein
VYLEGVDETPKSAVINSKKTIAQLQEEFGRATTLCPIKIFTIFPGI